MSTLKQEKALVSKLSKVQLYKLQKARWKGHWGEESCWTMFDQAEKKLKNVERMIRLRQFKAALEYLADAANFGAMAIEQAEKFLKVRHYAEADKAPKTSKEGE